jgi:hypothetical protein
MAQTEGGTTQDITAAHLTEEEAALAAVAQGTSTSVLSSAEAAYLFSCAFDEASLGIQKDFERTVIFHLVKDDSGTWAVDEAASHDELIDALYGGLISSARLMDEKVADDEWLLAYVLAAEEG